MKTQQDRGNREREPWENIAKSSETIAKLWENIPKSQESVPEPKEKY